MSRSKYERIPEDWSSYFGELRETIRVFVWMWMEFSTKSSRRYALVFVAFTIFATALNFSGAYFYGALLDSLTARTASATLWLLVALVAARMLQHWVDLARHQLREEVMSQNIVQLHNRSFGKFTEKTLGQHLRHADMLNHANIEQAKNVVTNIQEMLMFETTSIVTAMVVAYVATWIISPMVGCVLTLVLVGYVALTAVINRKTATVMIPIDREYRAFNRRFVADWEEVQWVVANGKQEEERHRLISWLDDIIARDKRFWFFFNWFYATRLNMLALVAEMSILSYGVYQVYQGDWTVGLLVPLYLWTKEFTQNLWYIGHAVRRLSEQSPKMRSMREALTMVPSFPAISGTIPSLEKPPRITFDRVSTGYRDGNGGLQSILRDFSLTIEPGEIVGLVGPSGSGKTTLARLLLRFFDPDSGAVLIDNVPLREIDLTAYRRFVGYIPQNASIFDGTLRDNLLFPLSPEEANAYSEEKLWCQIKDLGIDFGERLHAGQHTRVGHEGIELSGGQQQRVMVGAAIIKRPVIMVIDEATSSLDAKTEQLVQHGIDRALSEGVTGIVIAHRLSTLRNCDKIVVLNNGCVELVAESLEEAYEKSAHFRELADLQHLRI